MTCAPAVSAQAERIRERVAALALPDIGGHVVTLSCGVARWTEARGGFSGWMASADVGRYAVKRGGRNRVVLAA
jgi:PleD family two-component response regulator